MYGHNDIVNSCIIDITITQIHYNRFSFGVYGSQNSANTWIKKMATYITTIRLHALRSSHEICG